MHTISDSDLPSTDEVVTLYSSVGWTTYANDPSSLAIALSGSSYVVTARSSDNMLCGLARTISDDASICYIQDILVDPGAQRSGVGRAMVERILDRYRHVRQIALLTDDEESQRRFYESLSFIEARDFSPNSLRAFIKIG